MEWRLHRMHWFESSSTKARPPSEVTTANKDTELSSATLSASFWSSLSSGWFVVAVAAHWELLPVKMWHMARCDCSTDACTRLACGCKLSRGSTTKPRFPLMAMKPSALDHSMCCTGDVPTTNTLHGTSPGVAHGVAHGVTHGVTHPVAAPYHPGINETM